MTSLMLSNQGEIHIVYVSLDNFRYIYKHKLQSPIFYILHGELIAYGNFCSSITGNIRATIYFF